MFTASVGHLTMILRATAPPTVAATAPPLHTRSSNIYTYFNIGLSMCAPPLTFSLSCESPSFLLGRFAWLCVQTCVCSRKGASEQATTKVRASKPFRSAFMCVQFLGCNSNAGTDPWRRRSARMRTATVHAATSRSNAKIRNAPRSCLLACARKHNFLTAT